MTEERDPKLTAHYRGLPREEPPRALDDAILAASRRAVRRPQWLYPAVGIAAVMVLAVAISVHVEREQPDATAVPVPPPPKDQPAKPAEAKAEPVQPKAKVQQAPARSAGDGARRSDDASSRGFVPDPKPVAPPAEVAKQASPDLARRDAAGAGAAADRVEEQARNQGPVASAPAPARAPATAESAPAPEARARMAERPLAALQLDEAPMPWLERIAKLREEGRHDDADKALAEFRKRYPDFRIPEDMLGKVVRP